MHAEPKPWTIDDLLSEAEWLTRLARRLVDDASEADDVAQDTWIAALEHPPERKRPLRPWLAAVARNLARMRRRSQRARHAREQAANSLRDVPSTAELAGRLEAQRALVEALTQLREPYRTTVLLAYFEHCTSPQIAARLGVNAGTVRWRLSAAIDELRAILDRRHGERGSWVVVLAPLANMCPQVAAIASATLAWSGVLLMPTMLKFGSVLAAVALAVTGLWWSGLVPFGPWRSQAPVHVTFAPIVLRTASSPGDTTRVAREEVAAAVARPEERIAPATITPAPRTTLDARILDEHASPIMGAKLVARSLLDHREVAARSAADGRAVIDVDLDADAESRLAIEVTALGMAIQVRHLQMKSGDTVHLGDIVLAPGGDIAGRVLDRAGRALDGVVIALDRANVPRSESERRRRYPFQPTSVPRTETRADGCFVLEGVPAGLVRLAAGRRAWLTTFSAPIEVRAGQQSSGVELVLDQVPSDEIVAGLVVNPDGTPAPYAKICHRQSDASGTSPSTLDADEQGRFQLALVAVAPQDLDAFDRDARYRGAHADRVAPGTHDLVLRLTELERIDVIVRATDGSPIERFGALAFDPDGAPAAANSGPGPHAGGHVILAPPTAQVVVQVEAPGYELGMRGPFAGSDLPATLEFTLATVPSVRGRVTAEGNARQQAEITVYERGQGHFEKDGFRVDRDPQSIAHATTDATGAFLMTLRSAGDLVLRVESAGYAPAEIVLDAYDPRVGRSDLSVDLTRGGAIEGQVLMPPGREPAGTIVAFSRGDGQAFSVRVGTDGLYRADRLTPGRWLVQRADHEIDRERSLARSWPRGRWDEIPSSCTVIDGGVTRFDLDLGGGTRARSTITASVRVDEQPAAAWSVGVWLGSSGAASGKAVASGALDRDGSIDLDVAQLGPARLIVTALSGALDGMRVVVPIEIVRGVNPVRLDLHAARVSIVNTSGSLVPSDRLAVVWLGAEGSFAIRPVALGSEAITVPAGQLKLWRYDEGETDPEPRHWKTLAEGSVAPGATATLVVP